MTTDMTGRPVVKDHQYSSTPTLSFQFCPGKYGKQVEVSCQPTDWGGETLELGMI